MRCESGICGYTFSEPKPATPSSIPLQQNPPDTYDEQYRV